MIRNLIPALLLALQASQVPSTQQIRDTLEAIQRQLAQLVDQLPKTQPITTAAELQAALDAGGVIDLPATGSYAGSFTITKSGTILRGFMSTIAATTGPALRIAPGVSDVEVVGLVLTSSYTGAVLQCGDNGGTQTTLAQQPKRITLRGLTIPTHRGKRAIEFNCGGAIFSSAISDVWSSALADSQAIWIGNTCGPVVVRGGTYIAASENILVAGDTLKITDCPERVQADILLEDLEVSKPDTWRTDGQRRAVKNLLELKAGKRVVLRKIKASGSWGPAFNGAQDGSAIVITPKNGLYLEDVLLEDITIDRVAGCLQLLGKDYNSTTPAATSKVVGRNIRCLGATKSWGGRGIFAIVTGGMLDATFSGVDFTGDGNAIIICDTQTPVGPLAFSSSRMTTGPYGVMAPGVNFGGPAPAGYEGRPCVTRFEGNTLADAPSRFKTNYPANTWTTRAELEQLLQAAR